MSDSQPDQKRRRSDLERLDSWKAIANYFSRSVRTVRRWETDEGLPVHRHKHAKGSSVFAYTSELEIWRVNMVPRDALLQEGLDSDSEDYQSKNQESSTARLSFLKLLPHAAAAVAVFAVLVFFVANYDNDANAPGATVAPKILLLANTRVFGDGPASGESLRAAIGRDLDHHGHRIVRAERIEKLLLAMRRAPDTKLSSPVAVEVAKRDASIDAVIVPQLEKTANSFVISARIITTDNGETYAFPFLEETTSTSILEAATRLTTLIDQALAAAPKQQRELPLAVATTSSFEALTLYTQSIVRIEDNDLAQANGLLGMALQHDPEFLSALALRAWLMRSAESDESVAKLLQTDIDRWPLTTEEHLFIDAIRLHVAGDHMAAKSRFEILHNSRPDYPVAEEALLEICVVTRSPADCLDQALQLAANQPANFNARYQAARAAMLSGAEQDVVIAHVDNARAMATVADPAITPPDLLADALLLPALNLWLQGETEPALQHVNQLRLDINRYPRNLQQRLLTRLADTSAMLGRTADAAYFSRQIEDERERFNYQANNFFVAGDMQMLGSHLAGNSPDLSPRSVLYATMTSQPVADNDAEKSQNLSTLSAAQRLVIHGMRAAKQGDKTEAIEHLQTAVVTLHADDREYLFVGHDLLSKLLFERGQVDEAIDVLERLQAERQSAALNGSGLFWILCQKQLAHYYRAAERTPDARTIEDRLRNLLSGADENFPAAVALRATS